MSVPEEITQFMEGELVKRALDDHERIDQYLGQIEDFSRDWEEYSKSGNTTIYYKPSFETGDLTSFTFGGESIVKAPLLYPCTVLAEHELLHKWIPNLKSAELVHEQSVLKKLIHLKIDLFMPFSNRDILSEGTGFLFKEEKAVCFIMRSEHGSTYYGQEIDEECEGRVRMNLKHGFMHMQYIDENTCKFKVVINVDMKLSLAQGWVGKMVMNKVVKTWIYKIAQKSEKFKDTEFAKRMVKNPLYRFVAKRLGIEFPNRDDVLSAN